MSEASDRRNAAAQALGYSSYSQRYRAEKSGYNAASYNAAVQARATGRTSGSLVKAVTSGKLLGGATTRAGTVIAADVRNTRQAGELRRQIHRYSGSRHATVTIEMTTGEVINLGSKGGMRLDYFQDFLDDYADEYDGDDSGLWDAFIDSIDAYSTTGGGSAAVVTMTVA